MWEDIKPAPPDAILGLTEAFKEDPNPKKVNLGVGVYQDDRGVTPVLACVREAEERLARSGAGKSYLSITGDPVFGRWVRTLLFGDEHELVASGRAQTAHTPGGTGALRVGADFLRPMLPEAVVWMSDPTWANHLGIFEAAGFTARHYPYNQAATQSLDFPAMLQALAGVPRGHVVLLHAGCHNPTGIDPDLAQWSQIAATARDRGWIPFLDFAYQGFGESLEADRRPVLEMLKAGGILLVASSFSKNFGLYQDRVGALTLVSGSAEQTEVLFSHVKRTIRVNYSNPPAHGSHIVRTILADAPLRSQWLGELAAMRDRIKAMRTALEEGLRRRGIARDFSFITRQKGMFSFSGLTDPQVAFLREKKSIYIVKGGRINVAGITTGNVDYLCDAVEEAVRQN